MTNYISGVIALLIFGYAVYDTAKYKHDNNLWGILFPLVLGVLAFLTDTHINEYGDKVPNFFGFMWLIFMFVMSILGALLPLCIYKEVTKFLRQYSPYAGLWELPYIAAVLFIGWLSLDMAFILCSSGLLLFLAQYNMARPLTKFRIQ